MAQPSNAVKAGAAVAFLAVVGGIVALNLRPEPSASKRRTRVEWSDAGVPAGVKCLRTTGLASPQALGMFGMLADAGTQYVMVRICAEPRDGGEPALPPGMVALDHGQEEEDYDGGP